MNDDEITVYGTEPLNPDTDGDGCWDYGEAVGTPKRDALKDSDKDKAWYAPQASGGNWQAFVERAREQSEQKSAGSATPTSANKPSTVTAIPAVSSAKDSDIADAILVASKVSCEKSGSSSFSIKPSYETYKKGKGITVGSRHVEWDYEFGVNVSIGLQASLEGKFECELNFKSLYIQLTTTPIPLNLEVKPVVRGSASAKFQLTGPTATLTLGFKTSGNYTVDYGFLDVPYLDRSDRRVSPVKTFSMQPATLTATGTLTAGIGFYANIGIGFANPLGGAKIGFYADVLPLSATVSVTVGTSNCAQLSLGAHIDVGLRLEAWVFTPALGLDIPVSFYDEEVPYPGATFTLGRC